MRTTQIHGMFKYWNFSVNRSETPFFSIEADLALEHENIAVNVLGGIKGIRKNEIALTIIFYRQQGWGIPWKVFIPLLL